MDKSYYSHFTKNSSLLIFVADNVNNFLMNDSLFLSSPSACRTSGASKNRDYHYHDSIDRIVLKRRFLQVSKLFLVPMVWWIFWQTFWQVFDEFFWQLFWWFFWRSLMFLYFFLPRIRVPSILLSIFIQNFSGYWRMSQFFDKFLTNFLTNSFS